MIQCPKCSAENSDDSRFCKSCAEPLSSLSQAPTMVAPEGETPLAPANAPHVGRIVSSDSVPAGGFTPGTILADRYRIIGLLGRGGMGEVYRADDLKLGQPVALKFLPPALAKDSVRRERFFAEVRITRQLSHPNICRVYDIGEVDGRHFLSMEYIDGEDLASLMKRIGHLSNEKALDIARQLVAGLAVAHDRGVLHRDLKPANIMLDGHGRVRITDFGLAIAADDESQADEIAGTPAYMAPEQLAGKGATVRSDIYALGLILYEIYTGKKAFKADTLAELRNQKETQVPRAPSEIRQGIDPVVERVIQRCMEKDPNARPASMAQLAQALPGGDPLAAAIAAGETPSPEMVAASGSKEGLRPAIAWVLLTLIVLGTLAILTIKDRTMVNHRIPFENPPERLADRARVFLEKIGYPEKPVHSAYGYVLNADLLREMGNSDKTSNRWKNLDARAILFWYRQGPQQIDGENSPFYLPGEILIRMDAEGNLLLFRCVPPVEPISSGAEKVPAWDVFFAEAGLESSQWKSADSESNPPFYADFKEAWRKPSARRNGEFDRIEAAALRGKPVSFVVSEAWQRSGDTNPAQPGIVARIATIGGILLLVPAVAGGLFFARRNIKLGRGDRRNANRLAVFVLCLLVLSSALQWPKVSLSGLLSLPYPAILVWVIYMAIEPFVRRRWPQVLVSWTRLLSGNWRDPLVARDILWGCAFGVTALSFWLFMFQIIPTWLGWAEPLEFGVFNFNATMGARFVISEMFGMLPIPILLVLALVCLLFILTIVLRNRKAAIVVCVLVFTMVMSDGRLYSLLPLALIASLWYFVLIRFGMVAATAHILIVMFLQTSTITLDISAWYSGYGYFMLGIIAAMVVFAFYASLGGRPVFGTPRLDD